MLSRIITNEEYEEYQYLYVYEGWGPYGDDIRAAHTCQMIAATTGKTTELDDHMYFKQLREQQISDSKHHKLAIIYRDLERLTPRK